jgi:hypothetical protein
MDYRRKLILLILKLWKKRNYYKKWYEYEKLSNDFWHKHLDRITAEDEEN